MQDEEITCLIRGDDRVGKLKNFYGARVHPVLYEDLDDIERTIEIASQHDIVINTTLGFHPESAAALVHGLAKRKQSTGRDVYMIHTSGTSDLADQPISQAYIESDPQRTFNDATDDIYDYAKSRNEKQPYGQRTSQLGVIDAGIQSGVKTLVIMSPLIYGIGRGYFNRTSIQVPAFVKATLSNGYGSVVEDGRGVWDNVHVEDLADLYEIVLLNIMEKYGADLPFGKKGIIFSGNGRHEWREIAEGVAEAAYAAGAIESPKVKSISLEEAARLWPPPLRDNTLIIELGLSSNARTESTVGRRLGWAPTRGKQAFQSGFAEEMNAALMKQEQ